MVVSKTCPACGKRLSLAAFNGSARSRDGLARNCRACTNARRRQRERLGNRTNAACAAPSLLATALRQGDVAAVKRLVRGGLAPHWAWVCETMREGHLDLAELLLNSSIEHNVFTMAAIADVKRLSRRLRRAPADARLAASFEPASERTTPLHVACASDWKQHGHDRITAQLRVAELLVDHGADVDAAARYRGIDDANPLFCACWTSENLALVCWLLSHGARAGVSHLVAALGHFQRHGRAAFDLADALLNWGVPVDGRFGDRTPLAVFAHQANRRTVAWLLAHGAEVDARCGDGRTAVHFAAERNVSPHTLILLVEHGADLAAPDDDGYTPLAIARLHEKPRLVEWIAKRTGRKDR